MSDSIEEVRRLLNKGEELTLDDADEIGISRRHLRRLINQLRDEGLEINERRERRRKHFVLDPSSHTPGGPVDLQEKELYALIVAAQAAQSVLDPTPLRDGLESAVEKLLVELGPIYSFETELLKSIWHFDEGQASNIDPDVFLTVMKAANENETLEIDYFSASSREQSRGRRIDPFVMAEQAESWLVSAYCHQSQAVLDFSLAGISNATPTGEKFHPPDDFNPEAHFDDRFQALKGEGDHEVVLEVEAEKAPYFRRKTYHPTQNIRETREDGSIIVAFEVSSLDDIAAFIRSWGPGVQVREPAALAERIAEEAQAVAEGYEKNGTENSA